MKKRGQTLTFRVTDDEAEANRRAFLAEQARFSATPEEDLAAKLDGAPLHNVTRFARWLGLDVRTSTSLDIARRALA